MYNTCWKRGTDIVIAATGLMALLPLLLLITLLILFTDRSLPVFVQYRPGWKEKSFGIVKFRTMRNLFDTEGRLLPDEERVTALGKWLRRYSIDELPQFWNVLKGEMSLVGPRPLLTEYLPLYNTVQKQRHQVRPGITGWAQVNGRNLLSLEQKLELDVWYVQHQSFALDMKIILLTIRKVFEVKV